MEHPSSKDNALATILSDAPTYPPAPIHAAAPTRGAVEQGIKARKKPQSGTCNRSGDPSARITRIQAGTLPTRFPVEKNPTTLATKGLADTSNSPPICLHKGLPAKGAHSGVTQPPSALTPDLTPHEKGENSRVATPSAATPDRGKGNQGRSASSFRTRFSTPLTAHLGESLAPTAAPPTSPTGNSEDFTREHLGEAPLRTLPPALPTPTSPRDNPSDSRLQSAHFRLHGPGFLDGPIVPDQYILYSPGFQDEPNHPPPPTVRQASRQRTVI